MYGRIDSFYTRNGKIQISVRIAWMLPTLTPRRKSDAESKKKGVRSAKGEGRCVGGMGYARRNGLRWSVWEQSN